MIDQKKLNLTMLCDFYELTMGNGYFASGLKDRITYFDVFFRDVPDKGGFALCAGLDQIIRYIQDLHFSDEDIEYLRGKQETLDADRVSQLERDLGTAQTENESLKEQNEALNGKNETLTQQNAEAKEENERLKARIAELEQKKENQPQPEAPVSGQAELEAYRRAERVERVAKERASQLTQQAAQVLEAAAGQVELSADQIDTVSAQLAELFSRLQDVVSSARHDVREAADAVLHAADEA